MLIKNNFTRYDSLQNITAKYSAKTNNTFGLVMEPVFFLKVSALKIPGLP